MKEQLLSEKKEYISVDIAKFIAALFVIAIHIPPFKDVNAAFSYEFQQVFCRMAVPFFFLCTGFFLGEKLKDKEKTKAYVLHIVKMYLFWSFLYCYPMIQRFWKQDDAVGRNVLELLRRFFLVGSYIQLWYLLATIVAVLFLYAVVSILKLPEKWLLLLVAGVYFIGVLGNSYRHAFDGSTVAVAVIAEYQKIFMMTRNGIFFGFPFVTFGYLIAENRAKIRRGPYGVLGILSLALMFFEEHIIKILWGSASHDMYLMTPVMAVLLLLTILFIPVKETYRSMGKWLRRLSTLLFLLHMLLDFYLKKAIASAGGKTMHSLQHYIVVTVLCIVMGVLICRWQDKSKKNIKR